MWLATDTYVPAVKIGEVVRSGGAGRIAASNAPCFAVGNIVFSTTGWQDYAVLNPKLIFYSWSVRRMRKVLI